jgi:hypothetical protein
VILSVSLPPGDPVMLHMEMTTVLSRNMYVGQKKTVGGGGADLIIDNLLGILSQ